MLLSLIVDMFSMWFMFAFIDMTMTYWDMNTSPQLNMAHPTNDPRSTSDRFEVPPLGGSLLAAARGAAAGGGAAGSGHAGARALPPWGSQARRKPVPSRDRWLSE